MPSRAAERERIYCGRIKEIIAHMGRITRLAVTQMSPGLPALFDLRQSSDEAGPGASVERPAPPP